MQGKSKVWKIRQNLGLAGSFAQELLQPWEGVQGGWAGQGAITARALQRVTGISIHLFLGG